jgi:hypothetical protein
MIGATLALLHAGVNVAPAPLELVLIEDHGGARRVVDRDDDVARLAGSARPRRAAAERKQPASVN